MSLKVELFGGPFDGEAGFIDMPTYPPTIERRALPPQFGDPRIFGYFYRMISPGKYRYACRRTIHAGKEPVKPGSPG